MNGISVDDSKINYFVFKWRFIWCDSTKSNKLLLAVITRIHVPSSEGNQIFLGELRTSFDLRSFLLTRLIQEWNWHHGFQWIHPGLFPGLCGCHAHGLVNEVSSRGLVFFTRKCQRPRWLENQCCWNRPTWLQSCSWPITAVTIESVQCWMAMTSTNIVHGQWYPYWYGIRSNLTIIVTVVLRDAVVGLIGKI